MCSPQLPCKTPSQEQTHKEIRKTLNTTCLHETCSGNKASMTDGRKNKKKQNPADPHGDQVNK
jgi:hypothetical protein